MFFQRAMSFKVHERELSVVFSGICANSLVTPSPNVLLSLSHLTALSFCKTTQLLHNQVKLLLSPLLQIIFLSILPFISFP